MSLYYKRKWFVNECLYILKLFNQFKFLLVHSITENLRQIQQALEYYAWPPIPICHRKPKSIREGQIEKNESMWPG